MTQKVINLMLGSPGFPPPQEVSLVLNKSIGLGDLGKYGNPMGLDILRNELVKKLEERNNIRTSNSNILITAGASSGLTASLAAFRSRYERLLLPDPCYPAYLRMARAFRYNIAFYRLSPENGFLPIPNEIKNLLDKPALVMWNFPHNPTGSVPPKKLTQEVIEAVHDRNSVLFSDEVYDEFVFSREYQSPASLYPEGKIISFFSFSKTFALASLRVGYLHGEQSVVQEIQKYHWAMFMNVSKASQLAALAALKASGTYIEDIVNRLKLSRDKIGQKFVEKGALPRLPDGAFYFWIKIPNNWNSIRILEEMKLLVQDGKEFGPSGKGYVRLNYAADHRLVEVAAERMCQGIFNKSPVKGGENET